MDFDDFNFDDLEHKKQPGNIPPGMILAGCGSIFLFSCFYLSVDTKGELGAHAWNAVQIKGKLYLIDVTWDAGSLKENKFSRDYSTGYLFLDPPLKISFTSIFY